MKFLHQSLCSFTIPNFFSGTTSVPAFQSIGSLALDNSLYLDCVLDLLWENQIRGVFVYFVFTKVSNQWLNVWAKRGEKSKTVSQSVRLYKWLTFMFLLDGWTHSSQQTKTYKKYLRDVYCFLRLAGDKLKLETIVVREYTPKKGKQISMQLAK